MLKLLASKILKLETLFIVVGLFVKLMEHKRQLETQAQAKVIESEK